MRLLLTLLPRLRMSIDERSRLLVPPVGQHPQPVPVGLRLVVQAVDNLGQSSEARGALGRRVDDVVDGVGEGGVLEAAVDVPAGAAHACATVDVKYE